MKNSILFTVLFLSLCNVYSQNLRFSYEVLNPLADQSKLVVKVSKAGGGTEPMAGFNFGFYYKSTEATIEGQAAGYTGTLNTSGMNACIDYSYATALGWDASPGTSTGTVIALTPPLPAGVPAGYDRLFIGQLIDGNGPGTEFGSTPTNILALTLDNSVGPGANDQDSVYQCASDNIPEWAYTNESFDEFPIMVLGPRLQPLPITLVSFKADRYQEKSSLLTWTTVSEINSSHFTIQSSLNKKNWTIIGKVQAAGNSQEVENYEFIDENVYNGIDSKFTVYYRLQMVDLDDSWSKYSPIETVHFGNDSRTPEIEITVYPNPATNGVYVGWDSRNTIQPTLVELYDVAGKLVYSQKISDNARQEYIDFGPAKIYSGSYQLRVLSGKETLDYQQIVVGQNR